MVLPKKNLVVVMAVFAMFLVAACSAPDVPQPETPPQGTDNQVPPEDPMIPPVEEPTIEGTAATVNGEEISGEQIAGIQQQFAMQGMQLSAEEAIEQAVNERLLMQAAHAQGVTLSDEEVEAQINEILSQQGASIDDWRAEIEAQGLVYEEELENVRSEFITQTYLESVFAGASFDISQDEIEQFYAQQQAMSEEELPPLADVQDQIVMMLEQQAQQEVLEAHLAQLRAEADIVVN